MDFQSEVVDLTSRIKGSGKLEIAAYSTGAVALMVAAETASDAVSWQNVGSIEGYKEKEKITKARLTGDNADEENYVSDQAVTVTFNQREAVLEDVRAILRGTFDVKGTPVAGSLVSGYSQVVGSGSWAFNTFIPLTHQNGDGSAISITSVTGSTNGALDGNPDSDPDYAVVKNDDGIYGIVILDTTFVTTAAQSMTIVYDYTPSASLTVFEGGKTALPYFMLRFTNTDENGLLVRRWLWKCQIDDGYDLTTKKDTDSDPVNPNAVSLTAILDSSVATAGKKLGKRYSEKGL